MRSCGFFRTVDWLVDHTNRVAAVSAICILFAGSVLAGPSSWLPQGPSPTTDGQVENVPNGEVVGAINCIAPHPKDSNKVFVGAVNGGVWKTANAMTPSRLGDH